MLLSNIFVDKMSQGIPVTNAPVEIGDEIEVKIEKVLRNGDGVATLVGPDNWCICCACIKR
jgi:predicted RNA-binding protein with TRAM domain